MPSYPKITSKKIKYNSPSGYVNIGKYIPPFEKVANGFGFKGVIVEDVKSGKIQCHICGNWFEQLVKHLSKHKMNCKEYKIKFGLMQQTALKNKKMRLRQSKIMQKLRKTNRKNRHKFKKGNSYAGNRKGITKAVEMKNKYGICDLQVMQKIIELKNELGKTPTLTQLKDRYGGGFLTHIYKRYASYVKYCHEIGMNPNYSNFNPKYSKSYFIEKYLSNIIEKRIFTINEYSAMLRYGLNIAKIKKLVKELKNDIS